MRQRILWVALPLVLAVFVAVSVPAATAIAGRQTQLVVNDRANDATRFATEALVAIPLGQTDRLYAEIDAYSNLFDTAVWVVDGDLNILHSSRAAGLPTETVQAANSALSGQLPTDVQTIWPWQNDSLTIASPVGRDSQVIAAVVMQVPTDSLRTTTTRQLSALAGLLLVGLALSAWATARLSAWIIRPVTELESSAQAITSGNLNKRAAADAGPPELRGLSQSFNHMADTVASTFTRQREFVSDASHQLRNPIASLRIAVENLEPHLDGTDEANETYVDAIDDLDRMAQVVSGLLASTELPDAELVPVRLSEAIGNDVERWAQLCADLNVSWQADIDPDQIVIGPAGGLSHVLDELISNALRLSETSLLELRGSLHDDAYLLCLIDHGVGLPADDLGRATERFWRAKRNQNIPGTGLGLNIAQTTVTEAGGRLSLSPTPGGGLTVTIALRTA